MQLTAPASLSIQDLVIDFVKIRDADIVKLTLYLYVHETSDYTIFIHIEHCVQHDILGYVRVRT